MDGSHRILAGRGPEGRQEPQAASETRAKWPAEQCFSHFLTRNRGASLSELPGTGPQHIIGTLTFQLPPRPLAPRPGLSVTPGTGSGLALPPGTALPRPGCSALHFLALVTQTQILCLRTLAKKAQRKHISLMQPFLLSSPLFTPSSSHTHLLPQHLLSAQDSEPIILGNKASGQRQFQANQRSHLGLSCLCCRPGKAGPAPPHLPPAELCPTPQLLGGWVPGFIVWKTQLVLLPARVLLPAHTGLQRSPAFLGPGSLITPSKLRSRWLCPMVLGQSHRSCDF